MRELHKRLPIVFLVLPFLASLTASRSVPRDSADERGEEPGLLTPCKGAGPVTCKSAVRFAAHDFAKIKKGLNVRW